MTSMTVAPGVEDVLTDVRAFVQSVLGLPNTQVIKGIGNRAPAPVGNFVVLTPLFQQQLEWNIDSWTGIDPETMQYQQNTRIDIQCDIYGRPAGSQAKMLQTLWSDEYASEIMVNTAPLYADEVRMIPLVDSEQQYEERWLLTLVAQYNPVTTAPQGFADALNIELVNVQVEYPAVIYLTDSSGNYVLDSSGNRIVIQGARA